MNNAVVLVMLAAAASIAACASHERGSHERGSHVPAGGEHRYVLAYLLSGPTSGEGTPGERKAMFAGHMANINRLAQSRELLIAGPFDKPADPALRGLFVFDVPTAAEAERLVATDPGVIAGEFKGEFHEMRGASGLTRALDLYNEQQAAKESGNPAAGGAQPPSDMRKYVFIRAMNLADALQAANAAGLRTVWSGAFADGGGVLALDSTDPDTARAALQAGGLANFDASGWWSTSALMGLPRD